jgi:hypothetical protein
MVLDWYPMTSLTTPEDSDSDSSEQLETVAATANTIDASQAVCRFMKSLAVEGFSAGDTACSP